MKTKTSLNEKSIQVLTLRVWVRPLTIKEFTICAITLFIILFSFGLNACRQDCSEEAKMGDFEFSQGNFKNAVKHYERALKIASPCGTVSEKMESAKHNVEARQ